MKRVFQRTCQYMFVLNLFGVFCAADCMEKGSVTVLGGFALMVIFLGLMILFAALGGMFYKNK